ncbi:uncharacterized protein LOC126691619 [Quercus robur]|uniref:uncharacterized protein LOC126691619 n=1 Tax=Quercus robur TaxID=38942 RepID=UPI0021624E16|nr:uncharacterized protein LOC126691619 [Quercus robur]
MSSDASSDQSSVRDGAGYDEVFGSGQESDGFLESSGRETSAQSLSIDVEDRVEGVREEVLSEVEVERVDKEVVDDGTWEEGDVEIDSDEDRGDGSEVSSDGNEDEDDEESSEGTSGSSGGNRPFILPEEWAVNKFLPKMSNRVFSELRIRFQIPDHIPLRLPKKNEKCYTGRTADVGMYDAMFAAGLRLPLTALHRQLADFLGLSVSQISPNAWRIFIGAEVLWGRLSGGNRQLSLDEFFYCYRPQHKVSAKGTYHFAPREKNLRLVFDMPDSNRNWKNRFFFVKGTDWVCRPDEWDKLPGGYFDNTWAYIRESGCPRLFLFTVAFHFHRLFLTLFPCLSHHSSGGV